MNTTLTCFNQLTDEYLLKGIHEDYSVTVVFSKMDNFFYILHYKCVLFS